MSPKRKPRRNLDAAIRTLTESMARIARLVVPGYPHHVTQRGNRRQTTFFSARDYQEYVDKVCEAKAAAGVSIWAYCLMPNHVHLIAVPERKSSLAELFAKAHRAYTRYINFRHEWRGHLWQERFNSCVMDQDHLISAVRYVELNPVRAGLCESAEDWKWSSARAHLAGKNDQIVDVAPMLELVDDWRSYLRQSTSNNARSALQKHSRTGRPLGSLEFVETLESITGRSLIKKKPGRKLINSHAKSSKK